MKMNAFLLHGRLLLKINLFLLILFFSVACNKLKDPDSSLYNNQEFSKLPEREGQLQLLSGSTPGPIDQEATEDDWSLPSWVTKSDNAGLLFYGTTPSSFEEIPTLAYRWRDLNPANKVYDWSSIESDLAQVSAASIRLDVSDTSHVPLWVFNKYPGLRNKCFSFDGEPYTDAYENQSAGIFVPIIDAAYRYELDKFLQAFKEKGFPSNSKVHDVANVPGAYKWGEYDRPDDSILISLGYTPESYVQNFKWLMDVWSDAFSGYEYKLVYTGGDVLTRGYGGNTWRDAVGRQPSAYVVAKGMGYRTGMLEQFNFVMTELPNYGHSLQVISGKNYIQTDDNNPMIADTRRITENENEAFCYGDYPCDYYNLKMSVLKQLQMRHRYSFTNTLAYDIDHPIHKYFQLTAGKMVYDSPDAWCALREATDIYQGWTFYPDRQDFYISNWERWLYQREVEPDGKTERTYYIDNQNTGLPAGSNAKVWPLNGESYEARKTMHSSGSDYIYFNINSYFIYGNVSKVQIKVTYLDDFSGNWELQYDGQNDKYQSISITNSNDNKWKTVTFSINDGRFTNRQTGGNDFRLYNGGSSDLTVRFVRVIKVNEFN